MSFSRKIIVQGKSQVSVFRSLQNRILREQVAILPNMHTVLNIGSKQGELDKEGKLYRDYFPDARYFTLDKNHNESHPQHYNSDIHDLRGIMQKFDVILLMSVLEHVEKPWEAISQIRTIMHDDSYLFLTVPFFYPIHKDQEGKYSDYWRFTDDSLRCLFPDLEEIWIKQLDSVIISVEDRDCYWDLNRTPCGYAALFKNKGDKST